MNDVPIARVERQRFFPGAANRLPVGWCSGFETGCGACALRVLVFIVITPRRVVAFTAAAILIYVFWQGPERFYYESFGTWIVSPGIYVRLLPSPLNEWLLVGLQHLPPLTWALHLAPLVMLGLSCALAMYSIWNKTLVHALISLALVAIVFSVYHFLQPLGITLIRY